MKHFRRRTTIERVGAIRALRAGMTPGDIAKVMSIPEGTISSWNSQLKAGELREDGTFSHPHLHRKAGFQPGQVVVTGKMTRDEFVDMAADVLADYRAMKAAARSQTVNRTEVLELKKKVEQVSALAASLAEQLNRSI